MKFAQTGANGINGTNDIVTLSDTCLSGARSWQNITVTLYTRESSYRGDCVIRFQRLPAIADGLILRNE